MMMKHTPVKWRIATFGLIGVLLALTVCSIGSIVIIWQTTLQARGAVHMNELYQQAHYYARSEDRFLDEYTLLPSTERRLTFHKTAQSLVAVLDIIAKDGDAGDRAKVQQLLEKHVRYLLLANEMFTIRDTQNMAHAIAFNDTVIDPLFSQIDKSIATEASNEQAVATHSLDHLDIIQRITIASTALVFAIGIILLVVFWKKLRGYQRQLNLAAEAELERVEQIALTDPLTGLPNHRTMMDHIEEELAGCQQEQKSCALVFVDLDHFKQVNDTWGHRAGDAVLCEVARRLQMNTRPLDTVGRYGGEEFVMQLSHVGVREAKQAAERLLAVLAAEPYVLNPEEHTSSPQVISMTASIGVAVYQKHGTTREALIEAADRAMYYAKQTGRNRVCLAGEETELMPEMLASLPKDRLNEVNTVQALSAVASVHDGQTSEHAHRMVGLAEATARLLGRSDEEVHLVRLAALFHDLGKIGIPDAILHKPGPLTEDEWTIMRRHPVLGQHILTQVGGAFELLAHIVVAHHERWDGCGYPHKLAQDAIPLGARILSVVDSYDAMTSQRPYRPALSDAKARAELQNCAGSQFDPQVVEAFLHVLDAVEQPAAPMVAAGLPDNVALSSAAGDTLDRQMVRS